jgi:APA family basic amino acid/polyamine antiporter
VRWRGIDWPVFAVVGGLGTAIAWLVVVVQDPPTRWAGLAWLAIGLVTYTVYRRRFVKLPLRETVRAPAIILGPGLEIAYRTIVVPVLRTAESEEALVAAARLASERGATIAIVHVIEVPLDKPLDADLPAEEAQADDLLDEARALVESYGVRAVTRIVRARRASQAIIDEAVSRNADLIVVGSSRRGRRGAPIFGRNVDEILKRSPCRVLVAAGRRAA